MKKSVFKKQLFELYDLDVEGLSFSEKIDFIENSFIQYQKEHSEDFDTSHLRQPWSDEELKIILSDSATKANCIKYARLFKRTYGSIEQIYRWSTTTHKDIQAQGRDSDKIILQIKRIYKELSLVN